MNTKVYQTFADVMKDYALGNLTLNQMADECYKIVRLYIICELLEEKGLNFIKYDSTNNYKRNHGLPAKRCCGYHKTKKLANIERMFTALLEVAAKGNNDIIESGDLQAIFDFMNNKTR